MFSDSIKKNNLIPTIDLEVLIDCYFYSNDIKSTKL